MSLKKSRLKKENELTCFKWRSWFIFSYNSKSLLEGYSLYQYDQRIYQLEYIHFHIPNMLNVSKNDLSSKNCLIYICVKYSSWLQTWIFYVQSFTFSFWSFVHVEECYSSLNTVNLKKRYLLKISEMLIFYLITSPSLLFYGWITRWPQRKWITNMQLWSIPKICPSSNTLCTRPRKVPLKGKWGRPSR